MSSKPANITIPYFLPFCAEMAPLQPRQYGEVWWIHHSGSSNSWMQSFWDIHTYLNWREETMNMTERNQLLKHKIGNRCFEWHVILARRSAKGWKRYLLGKYTSPKQIFISPELLFLNCLDTTSNHYINSMYLFISVHVFIYSVITRLNKTYLSSKKYLHFYFFLIIILRTN